MGKEPQRRSTKATVGARKRCSERDDVDRNKQQRCEARHGGRRVSSERRKRCQRERHLRYPEVPRAVALPDGMHIVVGDRRCHREVAERRRDESNGIERPESCSREGRGKRQPAVELEIQHATELRWPASPPARQRTVDPVGQRRSRHRERPRDPRGVASSIARTCEGRGGDDRSGEAPAEGERIDRVQIVGLPVVTTSERARDQELLKKERARSRDHESDAASTVISRERGRGKEDRDDPSARDPNPSCAHALRMMASIVPGGGGDCRQIVGPERALRMGRDARLRRVLLRASAFAESKR